MDNNGEITKNNSEIGSFFLKYTSELIVFAPMRYGHVGALLFSMTKS